MAIYNEIYTRQLKPGETFVIYQGPEPKVPPQPSIRITKSRFGRRLGLFLITISLLGFLSLVGPLIQAEMKYRVSILFPSSSSKEQNLRSAKKNSFGDLLWLNSKDIVSPANWEFSLIIPKIDVNVPIVANVNPAEEKEYKTALQNGVAHARGSAFPGGKGTVFIFGHSSGYVWERNPYGTVFYPLKNLDPRDEIIVIYDNKRFVYQIEERKIVEANNVALLSSNGQEKLILQTCWPPFTTWKRLIVIAQPIKDESQLSSRRSIP